VLTVVSLIVVIGVLIFVHEAGHFVAAKAVGIQVLRFSLGFGRPLVAFRRGETEYWISWIPFGGYVKMAGLEEGGAAGDLEGGPSDVPVDPARAFDKKPLWARLIVIIAGVTMNAVFALVVYTGLAYTGTLEPNNIATTVVDSVMASDLPPAAHALATLRRGDRILTVNGDSVRTWGEFQVRLLSASAPVSLGVAGRSDPLVLNFTEADTSARVAAILALSPYLEPVISSVGAGSAGAKAGFAAGDRILSVNGDTVRSWQDFARVARRNPNHQITVTVQRRGERLSLAVSPERREDKDPTTKQPRVYGFVGIGALYPTLPRLGVVGALRVGWAETRTRAGLVLDVLRKLVTGRASVRELGGPILIGQLSAEEARIGVAAFLGFMAFLSVNLAILNLLPIPILDGGQVVFLLAEGVRRKPLSFELRQRLTQIGLVVLLGIMILATSNDLLRLFGHAFGR
jgi:regulator of sigma E protease